MCDRIRTHDLLVRSQTLYPAELHVLTCADNKNEVFLIRTCLYYKVTPILSSTFFTFIILFSGIIILWETLFSDLLSLLFLIENKEFTENVICDSYQYCGDEG